MMTRGKPVLSLGEGTPTKENPKSEYRNSKQTLEQMNLNSGKSKTPNSKESCLEFYLFWSFEFVSIRGAAFGLRGGFRASNLFFLFLGAFAVLRHCSGHGFELVVC